MAGSSVHPFPVGRIGIIGGGQLARMMVPKAAQLGFETLILDPTPNSPAGQLANRQIIGDFFDPACLRELVDLADVTTFDIETIDAGVLEALVADGHAIYPHPALLATIQDKLEQKRLLDRKGIPTSPFQACDCPDLDAFEHFGFPLVQKARRGGYDGRGVAVLKDASSVDRLLPVPSLLEKFVAFEKELAVMVARDRQGNAVAYPVTEMLFDEEANILDVLLAPARIDASVHAKARELAIETVDAIEGVGVFGVELFLTRDGKLLVNEIAPRTHNSGHYTIEACATCQFEQHIRAIAGLPLGTVESLRPAAMINLLGAPGSRGPVRIEGLDEALAVDGASVHIYGKHESRPFRKMGHVTVIDTDLEAALQKAMVIRDNLTIEGEETL
jgi:5-(carboxyamino)imidazole ribonucleotide synthase